MVLRSVYVSKESCSTVHLHTVIQQKKKYVHIDGQRFFLIKASLGQTGFATSI